MAEALLFEGLEPDTRAKVDRLLMRDPAPFEARPRQELPAPRAARSDPSQGGTNVRGLMDLFGMPTA